VLLIKFQSGTLSPMKNKLTTSHDPSGKTLPQPLR
jgi:hypothetical protein